MPENVQVVIEGIDELERKLSHLGSRVVPNVIRLATEAAAKVVKDAANDKAPSRHVEMDTVEARGTHVVVAIGPDKKHWYYLFAETGTAPHFISPREAAVLKFVDGETFKMWANHPGVAARPFLRPALDNNREEATNAAGEKIRAAVEAVTRG